MSPPNVKIEHITEIHIPIEEVWGALIDIEDRSWNKWTRFEADKAEEGIKGKLLASVEGNDEWEYFDFVFGEIDPKNSLSWYGSVGPFGCLFYGYHTMRSETIEREDGSSTSHTRLIHTENFSGILPRLGLGLQYDKLDRNYLLINEALKTFVEGK